MEKLSEAVAIAEQKEESLKNIMGLVMHEVAGVEESIRVIQDLSSEIVGKLKLDDEFKLRQKELDAKEEMQEKRQQELDAKDEMQEKRQQELDAKEEMQEKRQQELDAKEEMQEKSQQELDAEKKRLREKEKDLLIKRYEILMEGEALVRFLHHGCKAKRQCLECGFVLTPPHPQNSGSNTDKFKASTSEERVADDSDSNPKGRDELVSKDSAPSQ